MARFSEHGGEYLTGTLQGRCQTQGALAKGDVSTYTNTSAANTFVGGLGVLAALVLPEGDLSPVRVRNPHS